MIERDGGYIRVRVGPVEISTTIEEIAVCLEELDAVLRNGTADGADVECVFKALNYLKKYRAVHEPKLVKIVELVERILKRDLEEGRLTLW